MSTCKDFWWCYYALHPVWSDLFENWKLILVVSWRYELDNGRENVCASVIPFIPSWNDQSHLHVCYLIHTFMKRPKSFYTVLPVSMNQISACKLLKRGCKCENKVSQARKHFFFFFAKEVPPPCFVSWQNDRNLPTNQMHGKRMNVGKN